MARTPPFAIVVRSHHEHDVFRQITMRIDHRNRDSVPTDMGDLLCSGDLMGTSKSVSPKAA